MKSQYLLSLSTFFTVTLGIISLNEKSAIASDATFDCQSNRETPATIIKTNNGAEQPIFHWNLDAETVSATPEELCSSVTEKLNNYILEGNDLSSLTFKALSIFPENSASPSLPGVCIAGEDGSCNLILFTLNPSPNPRVASTALDSILDPALQSIAVKPKLRDRGFQSTSYKVNFWDLFTR